MSKVTRFSSSLIRNDINNEILCWVEENCMFRERLVDLSQAFLNSNKGTLFWIWENMIFTSLALFYYRKQLFPPSPIANNSGCRILASIQSTKGKQGSESFLCKLAEFCSPSGSFSSGHCQHVMGLPDAFTRRFTNEGRGGKSNHNAQFTWCFFPIDQTLQKIFQCPCSWIHP